jgi:hypothetical protein
MTAIAELRRPWSQQGGPAARIAAGGARIQPHDAGGPGNGICAGSRQIRGCRRRATVILGLLRQRPTEGEQARSITDLADHEGVTAAYVCRLLPLTCLAPDLVAAILDGRQPKGLRLAELLGNGPMTWEEQRASWGVA